MLGIMTSDKATGAVVVGIPVAVAVLAVIWARPRRRPSIWGAVSIIILILSATGLVAAFNGGGPAAEQAAGPAPTSTGGPTPAPTPTSTCAPAGPALDLVAKNTSFGVSCLAAPARSALRISFDNEDSGILHSFHMLAASPAADPNARSLFTGKIVTGPASVIYRVRPLPPGMYYFQCDVHPTLMNGTFIVR